jgi:iduronate 2-sulfatase
LLAVLFLGARPAHAERYALYLLGGQSNMDGYGRVDELPEELRQPVPGVVTFHGSSAADRAPEGGRGRWEALRAGHGVGFASDGTTNVPSDRFGVELSLGRRLRDLRPDGKIALVKYSRGATSIDARAAGDAGSWDFAFDGGSGAGRGVNQYDHCLATLRHALSVRDVDGDGEDDELVPAGIVWMQGESDAAHDEVVARAYERNLTVLVNLLRAALRRADLPVVIGRISDSGEAPGGRVWRHGELVRAAQAAFVARDPRAALVTTTDGYGYSDPYHYDGAGYLDLGARFADALAELARAERAPASAAR